MRRHAILIGAAMIAGSALAGAAHAKEWMTGTYPGEDCSLGSHGAVYQTVDDDDDDDDDDVRPRLRREDRRAYHSDRRYDRDERFRDRDDERDRGFDGDDDDDED